MAPNPIPYPLDPVTVDGTQITVDQYVQDPTVITRTIARLAGQRFYMSRVFSSGPEVQGGAILFERPNPLLTDLYAQRRMQEIAPGAQIPHLAFNRGVPMVATPRKIGGQFTLTKEERRRNRVDLVDNAMVQAANTLDRDVEIMGLSELNSVIAAETRTTAAAATWASYVATTFNSTTKGSQPVSDLISAQTVIDLEERGHVLNAAIFHPSNWANLVRYYGASGVQEALASVGITESFRTPRQTLGKVKLFEAGRVGVWSNEFPLDENAWEDEDTDRTWHYAWTISPTFAVTDQFAIIELTGV